MCGLDPLGRMSQGFLVDQLTVELGSCLLPDLRSAEDRPVVNVPNGFTREVGYLTSLVDPDYVVSQFFDHG